MHSRTAIWTARILVAIVVLAAWQMLGRLNAWQDVISTPELIATELLELFREGSLLTDIRVTLFEVGVGLLLGGATGGLLGLVVGSSDRLARAIRPLMGTLYGFPQVAITPIYIFWFGLGPKSKIALVTVTVFFIFFFTAYESARTVPPALDRIMRLMGARRDQRLVKLVLPASTSAILSALQNAVPFAFLAAVFGEFIASKHGVGHLAAVAGRQYVTERVWAAIFVIAALGITLTYLSRVIAQAASKWRIHV